MKKLSFIAALFISAAAIAQQAIQLPLKKHVRTATSRAAGDTVLYMPMPHIYFGNPADEAGFQIVTEDHDGLTPLNPVDPHDFTLYYSTNDTLAPGGQPVQNNFYHPWESPATDSAFLWGATSRFSPPGTADNWLMFGPVTIPPQGAIIGWYDRTRESRDGYEIYLSTTFSNPISFSDFTDPPIMWQNDDATPSATAATDTTWVLKFALTPFSANGQQAVIAFRHTATDMSYLFLDEITLVERGAGSCTANFVLDQDTADLFNYTAYEFSSSVSYPTVDYLWDFGDSTTSTLQYPTHTYAGAGPYQLCLTITDSSGCTDTHCDSLMAGRSATGITLTVLPQLITGVTELQTISEFTASPNPVGAETTISYNITKNSAVELSVFDLTGNKIAEIENTMKQAGSYSIRWNSENMSKGMYLLQLRTGDQLSARKLVIAR